MLYNIFSYFYEKFKKKFKKVKKNCFLRKVISDSTRMFNSIIYLLKTNFPI